MNWSSTEGGYVSGLYQVVFGMRGWSVWYYGAKSVRLGNDVETLRAAQLIAEDHAKRQGTSDARR